MGPLVAALRRRLPGFEMHLHGPAPAPRPPLDEATRHNVEARLGHALPRSLVEIWTQIGNGGFGPGYGLLGLGPEGYPDDLGRPAEALYDMLRTRAEKPPHFRWPAGLFPICHTGCGILHCVDLATEDMVIWEPNLWDGRHSHASALFPTGRSLYVWFETWATGDTPSHWLNSDPATGRPRLAPMRPQKPAPRPRKPKADPKEPDLFAQG